MRTAGLLLILSAAVLLSSCAKHDDPPADKDPKPKPASWPVRGEISSLSFEKLFELRENGKVHLIDARHPYFYQLGCIPGAISLPADDELDARIAAMKPALEKAVAEGRQIVVYCNGFGCRDARTVSRRLARFGFDVAVFGGGWKAWQKAEMPAESASQSAVDLAPPALS